MILITGGRGAVATHLTALLHAEGLPVRLASAQPEKLTPPAGVPTVRLDLTDPASFAPALAGVTGVFLYAEPAHIGEFIDRAHEAGVDHIVLLSSSSVLAPDPESNPIAKSHFEVEQALFASPITTTVLRPGAFASNARGWAWSVRAGLPVRLPFPGAHGDAVHDLDIAEAARTVLLDPRHRGGHFTLTGPESLTFTEQLDRLAEVTGSAVTVEQVAPDAWKAEVAEYIPAAYANALLDWWQSTDGKPVPLTGAVEELTGHPARPFTSWLAEHATEFATPDGGTTP
ncbi:NAD(P)H-binding protein [Kitasatospora paracochleata]|uniref:Uncharacterized protein YbjT (DUF2867 family) n=1 Tax=Kitasatospora paracochleata TaxID=58354 RepID=A0ABT1J362_9ACTN|nr:NAD(P)H-binding protein [Kitasatospora paracochleata]MCP2311862.1 uncharacterized protein YbjT (DUF2867 family) [Kitasatospora paracochleata]